MDHKDLKILFEDNHLLVVVKPYGVPVQADGSGDPDMLTILKGYLVEKYSKPGEAYLGLVHRLDRPTGGVMVFAKTSKAASRLSEAIRNGEVEKRYLAVVEGAPRFKADKLRCWLKKFPEQNLVKMVPALTDGAKYAELDYKQLAYDKANDVSLLSRRKTETPAMSVGCRAQVRPPRRRQDNGFQGLSARHSPVEAI